MSNEVDLTGWRKSSRTHTNHCLELHHGDQVIRDTKNRRGPSLRLSVSGLVSYARAWGGEAGPRSA